jgi:hypothetical protein
MVSLVRSARIGLWALPIWAALLVIGTLTHQPPYQTQFGSWSHYVTTTGFLVSHLVASILGDAIGVLGFIALAVLLAERGRLRAALIGLVTTVLASTFLATIFGIAAFAQPAIGRAFLAGHRDAHPLYDDVNGAPLLVTALLAVLLLSAGMITYAVAAMRVGLAPRLAGWAIAVGAPVFAILGVALADVVQSLGAVLLLIGTAWLAVSANRQEPDPADVQLGRAQAL